MKHDSPLWSLLVACFAVAPVTASDQTDKPKQAPSAAAQIEAALKAGPPDVAKHATVKDPNGTVLRKGSNGWTCYPEPHDAMCLDATWEAWMAAYMKKAPFKADRVGLAYMLAGDIRGASNVDPFAAGPTADNQWVVEGPHVMILLPDPKMLDAFTTDPNTGGPYVMWKGTPYAHVMVPVGARKK